MLLRNSRPDRNEKTCPTRKLAITEHRNKLKLNLKKKKVNTVRVQCTVWLGDFGKPPSSIEPNYKESSEENSRDFGEMFSSQRMLSKKSRFFFRFSS